MPVALRVVVRAERLHDVEIFLAGHAEDAPQGFGSAGCVSLSPSPVMLLIPFCGEPATVALINECESD